MAEFLPAFDRMLANEGGFKLTDIKGDKGGQTYAGIARKRWPSWQGWAFVDQNQVPPTSLVREFYRENFWDKVRGDNIVHQGTAESLFDFAVNAGTSTAIKLAQIVAGVPADGSLGPVSMKAINALQVDYFRPYFGMAKIARYRDIVTRDRSQIKFLLGWINRTLKESA